MFWHSLRLWQRNRSFPPKLLRVVLSLCLNKEPANCTPSKETTRKRQRRRHPYHSPGDPGSSRHLRRVELHKLLCISEVFDILLRGWSLLWSFLHYHHPLDPAPATTSIVMIRKSSSWIPVIFTRASLLVAGSARRARKGLYSEVPFPERSEGTPQLGLLCHDSHGCTRGATVAKCF